AGESLPVVACGGHYAQLARGIDSGRMQDAHVHQVDIARATGQFHELQLRVVYCPRFANSACIELTRFRYRARRLFQVLRACQDQRASASMCQVVQNVEGLDAGSLIQLCPGHIPMPIQSRQRPGFAVRQGYEQLRLQWRRQGPACETANTGVQFRVGEFFVQVRVAQQLAQPSGLLEDGQVLQLAGLRTSAGPDALPLQIVQHVDPDRFDCLAAQGTMKRQIAVFPELFDLFRQQHRVYRTMQQNAAYP